MAMKEWSCRQHVLQVISRAGTALHTAEISDRQGCACEGHADLEHHLTRLYINMLGCIALLKIRFGAKGFFRFLCRTWLQKVDEAARFLNSTPQPPPQDPASPGKPPEVLQSRDAPPHALHLSSKI